MKERDPDAVAGSERAAAESTAAEPPEFGVAGERGIPAIDSVRSVQSRVTSLLTIVLTLVLGAGLLYWYYSGALQRTAREAERVQLAHKRRAQGESSLPPLGRITPPAFSANALASMPLDPSQSAPEIPLAQPSPNPAIKSPEELAAERRLAGPVLFKAAGATAPESAARPTRASLDAAALSTVVGIGGSGSSDPLTLADYLKPTVAPAVAAQVLPTQQLLLPKGAFVDCTLETAVNSSLPGMTTCITATDTFSADGAVVLMERGTKLVGETRGQVQQGSPRLFVLWTEARTPTGVVVPLASPGTDELGRSGLTGVIDRHWWQRFGSAILVSVIDGAIQGLSQGRRDNTVVLNPSQTSSVLTEVLRGTINLPPTIDIAAGEKIQILVARDVDFRSVYSLAGRP